MRSHLMQMQKRWECKSGDCRWDAFQEAVDYLSKISRLSAVGRSHPLTAASRANIGVESARVRNVTERQHTTAAYVCADTIPGVVDTWERGHASSSPLCACPDAPQLRGLFLPSRLSRIFAISPIMQIISGRLRTRSITTIIRDILCKELIRTISST